MTMYLSIALNVKCKGTIGTIVECFSIAGRRNIFQMENMKCRRDRGSRNKVFKKPILANKFQELQTEENEQEEYSSTNRINITADNKGSVGIDNGKCKEAEKEGDSTSYIMPSKMNKAAGKISYNDQQTGAEVGEKGEEKDVKQEESKEIPAGVEIATNSLSLRGLEEEPIPAKHKEVQEVWDIVIHYREKVEEKKSEGSSMEKGSNSTITSNLVEEKIFKDADLSPRIVKEVKSARKGKKQGNGEVAQPIRVQPKRLVSSHQSKREREH
ncbi:hypothetical protein HAX54_015223 [Datura stramonium]|uniref:Uncharacterized protein n=1 Tax=Datura stramonium TaxID=4076 RepID=A0ABS8TRP0_DATST|nr:hypothetical protein [Datura stramonium]